MSDLLPKEWRFKTGGGRNGRMSDPPEHPLISPFVQKLYAMLVEESATAKRVAWVEPTHCAQRGWPEGTFTVHDLPRFQTDVVPDHFRHSNFTSFLRQLNHYGFKKVDQDTWTWCHPSRNFQRGSTSRLHLIQRKSAATSSRTDLADVPSFPPPPAPPPKNKIHTAPPIMKNIHFALNKWTDVLSSESRSQRITDSQDLHENVTVLHQQAQALARAHERIVQEVVQMRTQNAQMAETLRMVLFNTLTEPTSAAKRRRIAYTDTQRQQLKGEDEEHVPMAEWQKQQRDKETQKEVEEAAARVGVVDQQTLQQEQPEEEKRQQEQQKKGEEQEQDGKQQQHERRQRYFSAKDHRQEQGQRSRLHPDSMELYSSSCFLQFN